MKYFFMFLWLWITAAVLLAQDSTSINAYTDSLQKIIAKGRRDTTQARTLCRLCEQYRQLGDYSNGLKAGQQGLELSEQLNDQRAINLCLTNIGNIYLEQGNYLKALNYYERSLTVAQKQGNKKAMASCLNNMGAIYMEQGNYPQALAYFQKSLKIARDLNNPQDVSDCLNNIGMVYILNRNYEQARSHFQQSLKILETLNDDKSIADRLMNIGLVYDHEHNFSEALTCYNKALNVYKKLDDPLGIANCLNNIGSIYNDKEQNYTQALYYFQESLKMYEKMQYASGISLSYLNIGNIYLKLSQPLASREYARKGFQAAQGIGHIHYMTKGMQFLYEADSALGDWKSAFEHHKLFKAYDDSLHNEEKAKEFGRIESKYQFEKEAQEAKRKEAEAQRLAQLETERRNNLQYLSIFAGIIALFGVIAFLGRFRIPVRVLNISLFASLLIAFEFLLILFDPILDQYTGGIPIQKLFFNSLIALGFAPLHGYIANKLKERFTPLEASDGLDL
jgi:tetratricopeptide (TPR) repeat protein